MSKDYSNISKLNPKDFAKECENLWANSIPGTEDTAKLLLKEICNEETPFVLSVEASYGMGKTYFFSRFREYSNRHGVPCIYISAWENDYAPSPFMYIFKEILTFFEKELKSMTADQLKEKGLNLTKNLLSCLSIQCGPIGFDIGKFSESFFSKDDEIKEFKTLFSKKLLELKKAKGIDCPLVIIIDELDRCRPDYALKTIEIMKHFFDLENIFFILPINKEAINNAVSSVFNLSNNQNNEFYLRKLINKEMTLPSPTANDYKKIAECTITKDKIKNPINIGYIENNDNYNGFETIAGHIGYYSKVANLTYRETVKVCEDFILYANSISRKINIEYLVHLLCKKISRVPNNISLKNEHPYSQVYSSKIFDRKRSLTIPNLSMYSEIFKYKTLWEFDNSDLYRNDEFSSYNDFYSYIDLAKERIEDNLKQSNNSKAVDFINTIYEAEKQTKEYQRKYGANDNDQKDKAYYDEIVQNNLSLFKE